MNTELLMLSDIVEDCVVTALDKMGDDINKLSFFCTEEEAQAKQEKAA